MEAWHGNEVTKSYKHISNQVKNSQSKVAINRRGACFTTVIVESYFPLTSSCIKVLCDQLLNMSKSVQEEIISCCKLDLACCRWLPCKPFEFSHLFSVYSVITFGVFLPLCWSVCSADTFNVSPVSVIEIFALDGQPDIFPDVYQTNHVNSGYWKK